MNVFHALGLAPAANVASGPSTTTRTLFGIGAMVAVALVAVKLLERKPST